MAMAMVTYFAHGFFSQSAWAQTNQPGNTEPGITYDELERIQDKIEDLNVDIYKIRYKYPNITYEYTNKMQGEPQVSISGMPDNSDKERLTQYLVALEKNRHKILNLSNRVGVYYITETNPEPKDGYEDFYDDLYQHLVYPKEAMDKGIEGNVMVKFIVNENGNVTNVTTRENIETPFNRAVDQLEAAAKNAVKETSGDWIPAKSGGMPVAHWVSIPIQFKIENPIYFAPL
jgi:TonB family protein